MDSFFGIGPMELIFILIFALIFLGPERLPGAVRQVANIIRQIQKLSSTLTQQLGDEFGDIRELDPRYQIQQMMNEPDEKEKEAAKKAEEKKKEEEKKKAEAKRKAEAKKKADEAQKKVEEAKKAAEAKAAEANQNEEAAADAPVADGQVGMPPAVAGDTTPPPAIQPKQRTNDEQTSPASEPFKQRAEARAAANSLIPKTSENSIAPPAQRNEAGVNGNGDESANAVERVESRVGEEEEA